MDAAPQALLPAQLACRLPPGMAFRDPDGLVWANLGTERRPIAALLVTPAAIRHGGAALERLPADGADLTDLTDATAAEAGWFNLASPTETSPTPPSPAAELTDEGRLGGSEGPDWSPTGSPAYTPLATRRTRAARGRSRSRGRRRRGSGPGLGTRADGGPARRTEGGVDSPAAPAGPRGGGLAARPRAARVVTSLARMRPGRRPA